ncbi:MAG: hypothetical protein ACK5PQ_02560 [Alphaproteobacteria bacterium]
MNKLFLVFLVTLVSLIHNKNWANCRSSFTEQDCKSKFMCVWDSRGCSVGSRPLEADSKGNKIQDNFGSTFSFKEDQ